MLKKIFLLITLILCSQISQAKVIELDALNAKHCSQQLLDTRDETGIPVFLVYWPTCHFWQMFEKTFNTVSTDPKFANRVFFRFNAEGDTLQAQKECLGLNGGLLSPTVFLSIESDAAPFTMPIKAGGGIKQDPKHPTEAISITPKELEQIITIPGMTTLPTQEKNKKLNKYFSVANNNI